MRIRDTAFAPLLQAIVAAATVWATTLSWSAFSLDPAGYLGSAEAFVDRALAAHAARGEAP